MVITQGLAKRLSHSEDVFGRTVRMGTHSLFKITGILKNPPANTMFRDCEYYCSYAQQTMIDSDWTDIGVPTFVLVRPNTNLEALNNKLRTLTPTRSGGKAKTEEFSLPRQPSRAAWPIRRRSRIRRIDHYHAGFHTHCDLYHPYRLHQLHEPVHRVQPAPGKGGWDSQSNGRASNEPPPSVPWRVLLTAAFAGLGRPALCTTCPAGL